MPTQSDITVNASSFAPAKAPENAPKFISAVINGTIAWPETIHLPGAVDAEIPSRQAGRTIPVRVYGPENGVQSKGIFVHIHGGGWVKFTHQDFDGRLREYANGCQMTVISVGYRLASVDPFPAAANDVVDVVSYLASPSDHQFAGELRAIGGESAGAHLAALATLHLAKRNPQAAARLAGVVLIYGCFDLSLSLPSMQTNVVGTTAVIDRQLMTSCVEAFLAPAEGRTRPTPARSPEVSPLFDNLHAVAAMMPGGRLPPALFICGTADPLLDDTLLFSVKWMAAGGEAVVKIYPGMPHAFDLFPDVVKEAGESKEVTYEFVRQRV